MPEAIQRTTTPPTKTFIGIERRILDDMVSLWEYSDLTYDRLFINETFNNEEESLYEYLLDQISS